MVEEQINPDQERQADRTTSGWDVGLQMACRYRIWCI